MSWQRQILSVRTWRCRCGRECRGRSFPRNWDDETGRPRCPICAGEAAGTLRVRWVKPRPGAEPVAPKPKPRPVRTATKPQKLKPAPKPKPAHKPKAATAKPRQPKDWPHPAADRAAQALRRHPERSNQWLSRSAGCSRPTVAKVRAELEQAGELPIVPVLAGEDGRRRRRVA